MKAKARLLWVLAILFPAVSLRATEERPISLGGRPAIAPQSIKAFSLRVARKRLVDRSLQSPLPSELREMGGLTRLLGYVVDDENHDLIVYGYAGQDSPPGLLEDLVVALRNAWLRYAPLEGSTYVYSFPGCSIDPYRGTIHRLQQLGQQLAGCSDSGGRERYTEAWCQICQEQQTVRVMGIPTDTHFAKVLVEADYDMKSVVDGTDQLDIPGLVSLIDMLMAKATHALRANQPISIPLGSMNRFWFCPDRTSYEYADNILLIRQCPVRLLTEEMWRSSQGQLAGTQRTNDDAESFARSFSRLFYQIASERRVHLELENLFRTVALAKLIKFTGAHEEAGLHLRYFLEDFPLPPVHVARTLPGKSAVREFEHRTDYANGYTVAQLSLPSCGGVTVAIDPQKEDLVRNSGGHLDHLRDAILRSRRSPDELTWEVTHRSSSLAQESQLSQLVSDINRSSENLVVFLFTQEKGGYVAYGGKDDPHVSNDERELLEWVATEAEQEVDKTVYLLLKDFPTKDKATAFMTTARLYFGREHPNISLQKLPFGELASRLQVACLLPGFRHDPESQLTSDQVGNTFACKATFGVKAGAQRQVLTATFTSKTQTVVEWIRTFLRRHLRIIKESDLSLMDYLERMRLDLKKQYELTDEQLDELVRREISEIVISMLAKDELTKAA